MTSDPKPGRLSMPHRIAEVLVQATRPDADPRTVARRLRLIADWLEQGAPPKAPRAARDPVAVSAEVHEVFGYWCQVFHKNAATKLTDDRAKLIADRMAEGATVARCKQAIDGCKASPHHNGTKDGSVYNEIGLIFRSADKLDGFVSKAPKRADWLKPAPTEVKREEPVADEATAKAMAEQLKQALAGVGRRVM